MMIPTPEAPLPSQVVSSSPYYAFYPVIFFSLKRTVIDTNISIMSRGSLDREMQPVSCR